MIEQDKIFIPFSAQLYAEFVLRTGSHDGIPKFVEGIVETYLDRTFGDAAIWGDKHAEQAETQEAKWSEDRETNGDPLKGYQWAALFVRNGTKVRMQYQGAYHYAAIQHEKLMHEGEALSPSEFARNIAGGTNRNAWRDLYLQFPGQKGWEQADVLRKQGGGRR